jgi:hypothetical protein
LISHNNSEKYCSRKYYPSAISRAGSKQAKLDQQATTLPAEEPLARLVRTTLRVANLSTRKPPRHDHRTPNVGTAVNLLPSNKGESEESDNHAEEDGESTTTSAESFFNRWNPAILGFSSREELERMTENCAAGINFKADNRLANGNKRVGSKCQAVLQHKKDSIRDNSST